jgi:hypothetical protein
MSNELKITLPPLPEGADRWNLYSEYQSPIGRDPWKWYNRIVWRFLMFWHDRAERAWHWLWDIAQPFKQPPMKYETKYHEMKVLKQDGHNLTVDHPEYVTNGQPVFSEKPEPLNFHGLARKPK